MKASSFGIFGIFGVMFALTANIGRAQDAAPLIKTAFETETGGWAAFGDGAKVSVTQEKGKTKDGKGSLLLDYALEKNKPNSLYLPIEGGKLAKMKSLRFWVRADHTAPLVVTLQEKDGGRYNAIFTAPGGQWQQVELNTNDFTLATDANDPKDPDGKLDTDKVETISVADLGTYFLQSDDVNLTKLFPSPTGAHTLLLSDFAVRSDAAGLVAVNGKTLALDGLNRPQLGWLGLGGITLAAATEKPLDGKSLKATYHESAGKFCGMIRSVPTGGLAGKTHLEFSIASASSMTLLVQLQEQGGGKYNLIVEVPSAKERKDVAQAFTDFKAADDSKDDNGKLDLDQVKAILILDMGGLLEGAEVDDTLWISGLRATTK